MIHASQARQHRRLARPRGCYASHRAGSSALRIAGIQRHR